jgi:hypothetical protein
VAEGLRILDQPGLHSETVSKILKIIKGIIKDIETMNIKSTNNEVII